ncbi:tRNA-guanine transglycosylase [Halobaculum sp. MBLA0143]|uniref:tRNA-guanine transglycosylase n=1 Tax=Halobaculum sp. MBLA0143 TaxID=3079933 RepID=UPI003525CCC6
MSNTRTHADGDERDGDEPPFAFTVEATAGDARAGRLRVRDTELPTPAMFPVVNFYGGGRPRSFFGGGIYRTVKELAVGVERVDGVAAPEYFDATMMSVASLTDYGISEDLFETYRDTELLERSEFESLESLLFLDSGGFKFLGDGQLEGNGFAVEMDQTAVYEIQRDLGGDVLVNLDHPIAPDDDHATRVEKARKTAENVETFLSLTADSDAALYLTLHGYNYSMMDEFLETVTDVVPASVLREGFDGIALGSLVPKKDDREALIQAVSDCREVLADWGMRDRPLHVLGIGSRAIPLLVGMGVDSFDSTTYVQNAINGKYQQSLVDTVPLDDADFDRCDCPVCSSDVLVSRMRGDAEYKKDVLGPVAVHNLIVQKRDVAALRETVASGETGQVIQYLEDTLGHHETMRKHAHAVVNRSLGGYF